MTIANAVFSRASAISALFSVDSGPKMKSTTLSIHESAFFIPASTVLMIVSVPALTVSHTFPAHVPTSENMALTVFTIVSAPALTAFHTLPAQVPTSVNIALTSFTMVSAPFLMAVQTLPAHSPTSVKMALTSLMIVSAPALTAFQTLPAQVPTSEKMALTSLTIVSAPAFTALQTFPAHVPTSVKTALTVLTNSSVLPFTASHTSPVKLFAASNAAVTFLAIVSAPSLTESHTSPAKDFAASNAAVTFLAIVSAPVLTESHTSPAKDFAASNAAVTFLAIVSPVFCRKSHTSSAHSPTFLTRDTTAFTTNSLTVSQPSWTFAIAVLPIVTSPSQFAATVETSPAVPARIKPKPSGMFPAMIARTPSANDAPLTNAVTAPIGPFSLSCNVVHTGVIDVANPAAPATINPTPNGILDAAIAVKPSTSKAPLINPTSVPIGPCIYSFSLSQLVASDVARPAAPATIKPMPNGT